jgi:thiosulfate/3-mercaptopyruvate sulfurtransferase
MNYTQPNLLIETHELAEELHNQNLRIYDCSVVFSMNENGVSIESGRPGYEAGHIPGAGFLDLIQDLSDLSQPLPMMLPPAGQVEEVLSAGGINPDSQVVLYSTRATSWATRAWWILRTYGFENVALLNGGWNKWMAEGRPVSKAAPTYPPGTFKARFRAELVANSETVRSEIAESETCLVNALPAESFAGTGPTPYTRPGRIASSVNVPAGETEDPESMTFLPSEDLAEKFGAAGVLDKENIIAYCGGGIAATQDAFALALLGRNDVAVYDGSLTEWAADPDNPMEAGD